MFTPIKSMKVYEQIVNQIKDMITKGILKKGDKLPSERELVDELGVSRASIREALKTLQMMGLVECRQGEGNYITKDNEISFLQPLTSMVILQQSNQEEILEFRKIIEVENAFLATKRMDESEIQELKDIILDMEKVTDENLDAMLDKQFHYKIAQGSKNYLVTNVLNSISMLMDMSIKEIREEILKEKENKLKLLNQHKEILKALEQKDPEGASKAMKKHFDFITDYYIKNKVKYDNAKKDTLYG